MQDPHRIYDRLRAQCPVAHSEQAEGFWVLTRYADVVAATLDTATFSSKYAMIPRHRFGPDFTERPPLTLDPPRHTKFRRLLMPGFTNRQVQKWEPALRKVCRDAIAAFLPDGTCNASSDYAKKVPLGFVCALMGIPSDMEEAFTRWNFDIVELNDVSEVMRAVGELAAYLNQQIEKRRTERSDDLISLLMDSEIDGERLDAQELLASLVLVLTAGLDTTWSALSSCIYHLAENPDDRRRLVDAPSTIPTAIEELLRFYSPVTLARETTREVEVSGVTIGAQEMVMMAWTAANRDPAEFPDADKVIIDRRQNRHVAFGLGPHRCIGAGIARLEMRIALEEWLLAIPQFELSDPNKVEWSAGHVWGPRTVPVRWPVEGSHIGRSQ